ncbi:MAG: hypothetical protein WD646_10205 [Actinomycetota bacterium]
MPKSRQQRRARARSPLRKRRGGTRWFTLALIVVLALGIAGILFSRANPPPLTRGASAGEHWHASYRIFICGQRLANYPSVEGEVHSHGDGFIHIHPSTPAATGINASLGTFLRLYETGMAKDEDDKTTLTLPDGKTYTDGDRCSDGKKYDWVFTNKGDRIDEDPSLFVPHDGDALVLRFGKEGKKIRPNPYSELKGIPEPTTGQDEEPAPD